MPSTQAQIHNTLPAEREVSGEENPRKSSEQVMAGILSDGPEDALMSSATSGESSSPSRPSNFKTRDFLRHTRLQILTKIFGIFSIWRSHEEPRKIAFWHNRKVAFLHSLLHLLPLCGAVTLLVLRGIHFWIGLNSPSSTTLQFVAKFHELLMQGSIMEVMFCIVRSEAVNGYVPLGALSGVVQAPQLSYLWSLDFLSTFTSANTFQGWRRVAIAIAMPVLLILTALVGPSSAVLMIPEQGLPNTGRPRLIVYTSSLTRSRGGKIPPQDGDVMHPAELGLDRGLDMDWSKMNLTLTKYKSNVFDKVIKKTRARETPGEALYLHRGEFDRYLRSSFRILSTTQVSHNGSNYLWAANEMITTIPTNFASAEIRKYTVDERLAENSTISVLGSQPVVAVRCTSPFNYEAYSEILHGDIFYMQADGTTMKWLGNLSSIAQLVTDPGVLDMYDAPEPTTVQYFNPVWFDPLDSEIYSGAIKRPKLSVGIFLTWKEGGETQELRNFSSIISSEDAWSTKGTLTVSTCSIAASWNSEAMTQSTNENLDQFTQPAHFSELTRDVNTRDIRFNLTGIDLLWDANYHAAISKPPDYSNLQNATNSYKEIDLAGAFALAISEIPSITRDWSNRTDIDRLDHFKLTFTRYGYGYSTDSTNVRLAMAVIAVYAVITVLYILYILSTGITSTAWHSAIELVALALQSKKPDNLGHTSVGIDCLDTFTRSVGIRVNSDNELELVFAGDQDVEKRGLRQIEKNQAY